MSLNVTLYLSHMNSTDSCPRAQNEHFLILKSQKQFAFQGWGLMVFHHTSQFQLTLLIRFRHSHRLASVNTAAAIF